MLSELPALSDVLLMDSYSKAPVLGEVEKPYAVGTARRPWVWSVDKLRAGWTPTASWACRLLSGLMGDSGSDRSILQKYNVHRVIIIGTPCV